VKVFISVPLGFCVRNIMRSKVWDNLISSGNELVVFSPMSNDERFVKEFGHSNVSFKELYHQDYFSNKNVFKKVFRLFQYMVHLTNPKTSTMKIKKKCFCKNIIRELIIGLISFFNKTELISLIVKSIDNILIDKRYLKIFEEEKPVMIISTHPFNVDEIEFLKIAKKKMVKIVSCILSWDNMTSKGDLVVRPDKLLVWNKIMKSEASFIHDYRSTWDVIITGPPQYDYYYNNSFKKWDKKRKVIVYATVTPTIFGHDKEVIRIIISAMKKGIIPLCDLIIRPHPKDDINLYSEFKKEEMVTLQAPGDHSNEFLDGWNPSTKNVLNLGETLFNADLLINVNSTISIDSIIFGTPVINICFDGYKELKYCDSIRRYYDYNHFSDLMSFNATLIAKTEKDLIKHINTLLINPELKRKEMNNLLINEVMFFDGLSSDRISKALLEETKSV